MLMGVICISDISDETEVLDVGNASNHQYLVVGKGAVLGEAWHQ